MRTPTPSQVVFVPTTDARWTATVRTLNGPLTAFGDTIVEAESELNTLLAIQRALENKTNRRQR